MKRTAMIVDPCSLQQTATAFVALSQNAQDIPTEGQECLADVIRLIANGLSEVSDFIPEEDKLGFGTSLSLATLSVLNVSQNNNPFK